MPEETSIAAVKPSPRWAGLNLPRQPLFWAVSAGHMTNDIFMSMGPVLLVFLGTAILPMRVAQIGLAGGARELLGALSQPVFGWLSDRIGGRWLVAGGVAWVVSLQVIALILALTGQFWLMLIPYALAGLGSGAFHPVGTAYAGVADPARRASNTAYFFLFGQTGLAIGPALAGLLLDSASAPRISLAGVSNPLNPIFLLSAVAVPAVLAMIVTIPNQFSASALEKQGRADRREATPPGSGQVARVAARAAISSLVLLVIIMALKAMVHSGSSTFLPALFERKAWTPAEYGLLTSAFWFASAVGGVIFGQLADHYDIRIIVAVTTLLSAPALYFLPLVDGSLAFVVAALGGALLGGTFSIFIVLAQQMIPAGRGFASGATMGFTFVSAALGSLLAGVLADGAASLFGATAGGGGGIGLEATYQVMAGAMVLVGLLAFALPKWVSTATTTSEAR